MSSAAGELSGKIILLTGGSAGLGLAMAKDIAAAGGILIITGRDTARGKAAETELGSGVRFLHHDATDEASWSTVLAEIKSRHGRLDGLVNNVGGSGIMDAIANMPFQHFKDVYNLNLRSTLLGLKLGGRMIAAGGRGGAIVNNASIGALYVHPMGSPYCSSKASVPPLAKAAALELAADGIRVNTIYPGVYDSELARRDFARKGNKDAYLASVPMRRLGNPEELGPLCVYLLSERSRGLTGSDFVTDGGKTIL